MSWSNVWDKVAVTPAIDGNDVVHLDINAENGERVYSHLFSSREAADAFGSNFTNDRIKEIEGLELSVKYLNERIAELKKGMRF